MKISTTQRICHYVEYTADYAGTETEILEVTEWVTGEGVDVHIYSPKTGESLERFGLSNRQWGALQMLMGRMDVGGVSDDHG